MKKSMHSEDSAAVMVDLENFACLVLDKLSKQMCFLDQNGNILAINQSWLDFVREMHGNTHDIAIGSNYLQLLESGMAKHRGGIAFTEGVREVLQGVIPSFTIQYSVTLQSVEEWFIGKVTPISEQGQGSFIITHENITDYKRLEQRYRQTVEAMPNAVVLINESGTILTVNQQTELAFGYSRTELLGSKVEMLVPERFRHAHVGYRQAYSIDPISRPMGVGRELYGLRKNGTEFPVEIGLGPIEGEHEVLVLSSIVDRSEHKRLEHQFRQAVESAPNAIVMINQSGKILMVNLLTEKSFGYARSELVGQPVEMLVPERFREAHITYRQAYLAHPQSRPMGAGRDLYGLRKDGTEFPVEIGLGLIDDENGPIVLSSIIDITERKNANDKLKDALKEKEMLLKEVYHRVKNNLQVVSSLINLQARNVNNQVAADQLKQSADRIKAMALLHEKLYQSKDLSKIDFNVYIRSLVDYLLFGYGSPPGKIHINFQIDNIFLDVDTAISCGLIVNELISNAIKHAFPNERRGEICIRFRKEQEEFVLVVADDGVGLPVDLDFKKCPTLGLQLVNTLTNQLMGSLTLDQGEGAAFSLRFAHSM